MQRQQAGKSPEEFQTAKQLPKDFSTEVVGGWSLGWSLGWSGGVLKEPGFRNRNTSPRSAPGDQGKPQLEPRPW